MIAVIAALVLASEPACAAPKSLLAMDMPAANKQTIEVPVSECRAIIAESQPAVAPATQARF